MGLLDDSSSRRRNSDTKKTEPLFGKEIDNKRDVKKRTEIGGKRILTDEDNLRRNKELDYLTRGVLDDGLKNLFNREKFNELIDTFVTLNDNSGRNIFLIHEQKPDAKLVMGSVKWNYYGYTVNPDAIPIKIFVPAPEKSIYRGKKHTNIRFFPDNAFDVSDVRKTEDFKKENEYSYVDFAIGRNTGRIPAETSETISKIICNLLVGKDIDVNSGDWINSGIILLQNNPNLSSYDIKYNRETSSNKKIEMNINDVGKILEFGNKNEIEFLAHNLLLATSEFIYRSFSDINLDIGESSSIINLSTVIAERYFGLNKKNLSKEILNEIPFDIKNNNYKLLYIDNIGRVSNRLIKNIEDICIKNEKRKEKILKNT